MKRSFQLTLQVNEVLVNAPTFFELPILIQTNFQLVLLVLWPHRKTRQDVPYTNEVRKNWKRLKRWWSRPRKSQQAPPAFSVGTPDLVEVQGDLSGIETGHLAPLSKLLEDLLVLTSSYYTFKQHGMASE